MITITNRKIAGFEPQWAPFRGFSLLFDNPGEKALSLEGGWLKVNCSLDGNKDLGLYAGLVRVLEKIGTPWLTNTFLFCPLPPNSYHVTVWDGINAGNVQVTPSKHRLALESLLERLPQSLLTDRGYTDVVHRSPLITTPDWSVAFEFEGLVKWGNQVLVACLRPADQESEKQFNRIVAEREALYASFREQFGIDLISGYNPHITLGYFANEEPAETANSDVDRWNRLAATEVDHLTITFRSIGLYSFTDMVTFFRSCQRDTDTC